MADSAVVVTQGTGTNIDTRTESTNGNHRQVVVLGDPSTNAGVAPVDATAGLKVDLGADNDITLATLPDTSGGDLAAINTNTSDVATQTTLALIKAKTDNLDTALSGIKTGTDKIIAAPATAAKQPALGTAGTASSDVITIQGIASMTAVKVDGSGVTQPVSAASLPLPTGAATAANQQTDALTDTQLRASAVPVSLASVPSHAVTNAGTFAVQESGGALTSLQLIDDVIFTDDTSTHSTGTTKVAGIGAVALPTDTALNANDIGMPGMSVGRELYGVIRDAAGNLRGANVNASNQLSVSVDNTVTVGSHAVTNAGTFAVQVDGSALTSLQLIDDVIYVDDADWTEDASKHALVGAITQSTPTANTDGDTTPLITNSLRELRTAALESDLAAASTSHTHKYYTASAPTDGIIWSPATGKRWYVTHLSINVSAASTVTIEDDKAGGDDPVYKAEFAANSGVVLTFPDVPLFSGEDAADLTVTASAGTVYVTAVGYEI